MKKKKVNFVNSMMFKLASLFVTGVLLTSVLLMSISIMQSQKSTKGLVQNYMLSEATSRGYILNEVVSAKGEAALENVKTVGAILGDAKIEGMDSSYAYLVSSEGTMLYHPTADKIGSPVENSVVTQLVEELKSGNIKEPECVSYDFKGVVKYASYYINPDAKFILVITADEEDAFYTITQTRNILIGVLAGILLVFTTAGCLIIRRLIKPLHVLTDVVDKVADLDFTEKGALHKLTKRKDEIGLISAAIDNLHNQLREIISIIQSQGERLAESNAQFSKGFAEIVETVDNVNTAVEEVAMGSTSQAQETNQASEHITDIGNAIESNSASVEALEDSIKKMNDFAKESDEMLAELVKMNDNTTVTIGNVTEQTDLTNKSVSKINEAVVAIQDIASQTNLLSLNASIEAARAGESGRGFAVVAEQIRKLSEDSSSSATEIEAIVRELISNSEDSVAKMYDLSEDSKVEAEKLGRTKESFDELKKEIATVSVASKEIFEQTDAINRLKDGVSGVIEQLAAIAQENAASTEETSASMHDLTENIDKCKDETKVLADLSEQLSEQTSKFRF